jgi:hypothetical protein
MITALKQVYLTKDGKKLVSFGHKEAAILLFGKGQRVPESRIAKFEVESGLFPETSKPAKVEAVIQEINSDKKAKLKK